MARSGMTRAFTIGNVNKFQKAYREQNEDCKKKNIARYITVDVVNRKGVPDIEDCLVLIKLGNNNCSEEEAEKILYDWLEDKEIDNKSRGITGAFCELCKDYCLDVPVDSLHKTQCEELESIVNKRLEAMGQLNNLLSQLGKLGDIAKGTEKDKEELGVETKDTQE